MAGLLRNFIAPVAVLAAAAVIALWMVKSRSELPMREAEVDLPLVQTVVVHPGPVPVTIRSRGTVSPRWSTELVSEVSGRVIWAAPEYRQGGQVLEGQELLRIDPIDYEVAVSDARAALASAELSLAEVQVVRKQAAVEEAQARVEAARARLRQAETDLRNTHIRAPFNAVVDVKRADLGQFVQTGTGVMRLLSTDVAEVRLPVLASDVPFVRFGEDAAGDAYPVTLTASFGSSDYSWQGELERLEQRVDDETRVFFLVVEVERPYDSSRHQRPMNMGLFVEAEFPGEDILNAVRLPRSALHNGNQVYVVRDGRIYRREVSLLRREQDSVVVRGLEDGQRVVLSRLDLMVDGMAVATSDEY